MSQAKKPPNIDQQIRAFHPLDAARLALLAGYANAKQFTDYRAKGRVMPDSRLEKLAKNLELLAMRARTLKTNP